ncbi:atypical chemokine receptor 2 isoform X2 [Anguilla anguilla]|uniref:atypical chemokine receptor 2 isoform X2 n=1 Tax=Anguilla anguilla TaxID=7936 RepID=UPI0015AD1C54|nr:atypical chemokine receptor 2 isoform X2 [Anguilla anguilla]
MPEPDISVTAPQEFGSDYDYSHYYAFSDGSYQDYGLCEKTHVRAFGRIFLPVFYTFVCALDIVGNTLLVFILIKYIKPSSVTSVYLLNMAASDILFAVTLPFWAVYAHSEWIFGDFGCKTITLIYTVNLFSSIYFITCISLDRYLNIVWASSTNRFVKSPKCYVMCIVVWALSFLAAAPDLNFVKLQEFDGKKTCTHEFGVKMKLGKKSRTLKLAVALVVVFFVLWFPYNLVLFLHSLQDLHVISDCATSKRLDLAIQVTESLAFTHTCLNPILYAFVNKRFRSCLFKILKKVCKRGRAYSLECTGSTSISSDLNTGIELTMVENVQ